VTDPRIQKDPLISAAHDANGLTSAATLPVTDTAAANPWQKQAVKQAIGLGLAALFLWLSFRNVNMLEVWQRMQALNPIWVVGVCCSALVSHWIRAVRWVIMLQPLADNNPLRESGTRKISTWNAFCAVIIGYAVNIAVPRGGEVARVVSICKTEQLPWAGVLPTMLIDRLLDFAMLVLLVGTALVMLPEGIKSQVTWLVPAGAFLCAATLIGLLLLPKLGVIARAVLGWSFVARLIPEKIQTTIKALTDQFEEGTACLGKPTAFPAIGGLTFLMWGFYFLNMELMLYAFGMQNVVDPVRCLMVFAIGSVGVVVPTPGSVGTYHLCASQALNMVAGIKPTEAMAFVTAFHAVSFVFIVCLAAAVCFMVQSSLSNKERIARELMANNRDQ
jgi:glycosyltransferase 2 family protein